MTGYFKHFFSLCCFLTLSFSAFAAEPATLHTGPYLQLATPHSIHIMWETTAPSTAEVLWDTQLPLTQKSSGQSYPLPEGRKVPAAHRLHNVHLQGLAPATRYYYQVLVGETASAVHSFVTEDDAPKNFAFLAMSDAQHGTQVTSQVVQESVLKHAFREYTEAENFPVSFSIFPGDLVQNGDRYPEWKEQWFDPLAPILASLPTYPAPGNHEKNHELYYAFFDVPKNGSSNFLEHWYYFDYQNVRFISLDTNFRFRLKEQLLWLEQVLEDTKNVPKIQFVAAYFHHPHRSELWEEGSESYSGELVQRLEKFSWETQIPSIHFCGHSHGYSRGHSFWSNHSMVNVASLGGEIDYWGQWVQKDYDEYVKSLDEHGWVLVQVENNEKPQMHIKRYSFGNAKVGLKDRGIVDAFSIRTHNQSPEAPLNLWGKMQRATGQQDEQDLSKTTLDWQLQASPFQDPDGGDAHLTTHIQVANDPQMEHVLIQRYFNRENWFMGQDQNKHLDLTHLQFQATLSSSETIGRALYWRIRYRDEFLGWSEWSQVSTFEEIAENP